MPIVLAVTCTATCRDTGCNGPAGTFSLHFLLLLLRLASMLGSYRPHVLQNVCLGWDSGYLHERAA